MKKMLAALAILVISLLIFPLVVAHENDTLEEAEHIIASQVTCDQLTQDQLEIIGDYYMEQFHPGEAHVAMDKIMGGEGSPTLRQAHINMAVRFYCNQGAFYPGGGMGFGGVMDGIGGMMGMMGMPGMYYYQGGYQTRFSWTALIINILVILILVLGVLWLAKQGFKNLKKK
ncbi:MAG: hypothetical protein J4432_03140 [DPANN group archaeon]|nr:hypothetical protein [DPANN group archaeon]